MKKYPLKISYAAKTALWAGKRLKTGFGKCSEHERISETWELSVRQDDEAVVLNGDAAGLKLREYFDICGYDCVTPKYKKGDRFPLLIKLIDADDTLSVQVHPDGEYASRVENDSGKTEAWHIISAREGAQIIYGLREGATREELERAINGGCVESVMRYQSVRAGETYFIPAGMVHAIGEGILIAEIQQSSDTTYRLYDYDRLDKDGKKRPLHIEDALACTKPDIEFTDKTTPPVIAKCDFFKVEKLTYSGKTHISPQKLTHILVLNGEGTIKYGNYTHPVTKYSSILAPVGCSEFTLEGDFEVLVTTA